ncbi:MAG: hypothetical protein M1813_005118 [Trichoglossum hirsutum]|jgi:hypothetical protein|nr:MAG: hypothetical protein M1813_005118 [Trichoglossum hirsutum]
MSGNNNSSAGRPLSQTQSTGSSLSSSGSAASPRSPFSPFGSPPMGYFEEPQNEHSSSQSERQSKWNSLPQIRTTSRSPRPTKHRSASSTDETASARPPTSPTPKRNRNSGTFSDVGRHSNEWLFRGYGARELVNSIISPSK